MLYYLDEYTYGFIPNILEIFSILSIFFAIYTIISKNPVVSILFLIALFTSVSLSLMTIGLVFIGLSYLLVYIGAVSILFLFILMLINIRISELVSSNNNYIPLGILSIMMLVYILKQKIIITILQNSFLNKISNSFLDISSNEDINFSNSVNWDSTLIDIDHINSIGNVLYSNYSIWLIIISIILLLAMVGTIVITINR